MTIFQNIYPLWICLGLYLAFTIFATAGIDKKYKTTTHGYWLSSRNAPSWLVAISASSAWLWVLGLLLISRFSIQHGPAGIFWYILPFLATSVMFGYFVKILMKKFPKGFSLNSFINTRYDNKKLTYLYQFLQVAACMYAISGTLTSFGTVAEYVSSDFNYNVIVAIVGLTVLGYSIWGGQKACHRTDVINIVLLLMVSVIGTLLIAFNNGGISNILQTWYIQDAKSIFDPHLMWSMGMFLILIFVGSFLADNMQYQNAFSLGDRNKAVKTYWGASLLLLFIMTGFAIISGSVFTIDPATDLKPDVVQMYIIQNTFGFAGVLFFMLTVLFKASSVMDSTLNGAGLVMSNDVIKSKNPIAVSKIATTIIMILSIIIAIMRIDIWVLVSTFGLLRIIMIAPTVYGVLSDRKIKTNLLFYVLILTTLIGIGSTFTSLPIDRAGLGLLVFIVPTIFILYEHYQHKKLYT